MFLILSFAKYKESKLKDELYYKQTRYYIKSEEKMNLIGLLWSDFEPNEKEEEVCFQKGRGFIYTREMLNAHHSFYEKKCGAKILSIFRGHQHHEAEKTGLLWPLINNNGVVGLWNKEDWKEGEFVGKDFTLGINLLNSHYSVFTLLASPASRLLFNKDTFVVIDFKSKDDWTMTQTVLKEVK